MRQCILHIGLPKTGSSSIQRTLAMNQDVLAANGIVYQTTLNGNKGVLAHHKLGASLRGASKQSRLEGINLSEFGDLLRSVSADVVLVSSESLGHPRLKREKLNEFIEMIARCGFSTTAIAYIRPQPPLSNSAYTQVVKTFTFNGSFDDFISKRVEHPSWRMSERLKAWSEQPNIRFIAVPFTRENTGLDIAAKMLKVAGIPSETVDALALVPAGYVNEAPGPLAVAGFRLLGRQLEDFRDLKHQPKARKLAVKEAKRRGWFSDRFVGLDQKRADRIRAIFEKDNEGFAHRFFERPWHEVFAADYERQWEPNEIDLNAIDVENRTLLDDFLGSIQRS
jgi:hypothetical protein